MIIKTLYMCFVVLNHSGSMAVDHKAVIGTAPGNMHKTRVLVAGRNRLVGTHLSAAEVIARIKKCELALDPGAEGEG